MLLSGLLLLASLLPQDGCKRCDHRGMIPCKQHTAEMLDYESRVQFCSIAASCEDCGGTFLVDCPHCDGGPATAEAAARRAEIEKWMQETELERVIGRRLPRIETEHFQLVIDTGPLREGRKRVDAHTLAHRIADDVERVATDLIAHFDLTEDDFRSKMRMWIWMDPEDHSKAMVKYFATGSSGDFKMLGRNPTFSCWTEPGLFDNVDAVRTLFAHNAAHMLLSNALFPLWIGDIGGGWLDAGVGHWYEYEIFGRTTNYCIEESTAAENYENGLWRAAIRRRLEKSDEPFLPGLLDQNTGAMTQPQQALCWSFFDWLVATHQPALRPILADLKTKQKDVRDIFTARLGLGVLEADAAWRAWVSEVYPRRGDKPRTPDDGEH